MSHHVTGHIKAEIQVREGHGIPIIESSLTGDLFEQGAAFGYLLACIASTFRTNRKELARTMGADAATEFDLGFRYGQQRVLHPKSARTVIVEENPTPPDGRV